MRTLSRGIGIGGTFAGLIGMIWGPEGWTYWHFVVLGIVLWRVSTTRATKEATDYTATMLIQAGYTDPDDHLPEGIKTPDTRPIRGGLVFLVVLATMGAILWPARAHYVDDIKTVVTELNYDAAASV